MPLAKEMDLETKGVKDNQIFREGGDILFYRSHHCTVFSLRNVARCILMVMIIAAVSLSSFCLLKQMCSLKAENARLRGEHQRYLYLKEMIRAQVPEDRFIHNMPRSVSIIETDKVSIWVQCFDKCF